ncbi:hypothetical protein HID58_095859 [Brassica napus]|uniref:Uncharacterized protein n=1 Tax=Brassica napus TaxID=3708 RepID=A0ABQ7X2A2_BRANA|nr:hypothetical protein HID58_095859 [Brassica napus]
MYLSCQLQEIKMEHVVDYLWKDRNCQVMLELVIAELRAGDYRSRMPDAAAKKRIENKYFELVEEKICWDPEITNKIGYLHKLWSINGQLIKRTGVAVDQSTGQINMMQTWWADRIAVRIWNKGKFVSVLQKKPLPFKDLLDQIFGEHDVEQDERYSPHMLGQHIQQIQPLCLAMMTRYFTKCKKIKVLNKLQM